MPFTVPRSSVKLVTVNGFVAALVKDNAPAMFAAKLLTTLFVVKVTPLESRNNNFAPSVPKLIAPPWVIVPPVSNVKTPAFAKFAAGVQALIIILPDALFPILTFVARISLSAAALNDKFPAPPAMPIVRPAVLGNKITLFALPAPAPVPPICAGVALVSNDIVSAVKVPTPVVNINEPKFKVNVPVPALALNAPEPEFTVVLAAWVIPVPVREIALFVVLMF